MIHHPPTVSHRIPHNPTVPLDPMPQETLREPHRTYRGLRVLTVPKRTLETLRDPLRALRGSLKERQKDLDPDQGSL